MLLTTLPAHWQAARSQRSTSSASIAATPYPPPPPPWLPLLAPPATPTQTGELQRVAICLCLGQPANVYLIDEPSAYLDSEQRILAAKVIKR